MKHRLYHPPPVEAGARLTLDPDRAHYLTRVLRLRRGESLVVFNGLGRGWAATLENAGPRSATLAVGSLLADEPPPRPRLHLIQGLLKGAAMDQVVQKATELGATDLWLVHAARSNMPREAGRLARKLEHWQRVVESAAEQCKALHLPRLHPLRDLAELLARPPAATLILLHPGAETLPLSLPRQDTALLVGPEGGWSEAERQAAGAAGARVCGLGDRVLRAETAPLVALSALRHGWGWT